MKRVFLLVVFTMLVSCWRTPFYLEFRAELKENQIPLIKAEIKNLSYKWNFNYLDKNNKFAVSIYDVKTHSIYVMHKNDPILNIINLGIKPVDILSVTFSSISDLPDNVIDKFASELICTLQKNVGLKFNRVINPRKPKKVPLMPKSYMNCE